MFKVVDNNLTSIFNKSQNISQGFNLATDQVNHFVDGFNKLNTAQNFGNRWDKFINGAMTRNANVASYFQELAKQGASAKANIQGVYAAILDGNTKGISNVKSVISAFNTVNPENQKAFAQAVGQTNAQLGNYLGNLNGATASMSDYGVYLVANKIKTVALQTATIALNMAISAVMIGLITSIPKVLSLYAEFAKKAKENLDVTKDNIESLEDIKDKYLEAMDSTTDLATKTELLAECTQILSDKYDIEKSKLEEINTEREKGIGLIEDEIRAEREKWYINNKNAIERANKSFEADASNKVSSNIRLVENTDDKDYDFKQHIRQDIINLFDSIASDFEDGTGTNSDYATFELGFSGTSYEVYLKTQNAIDELAQIGYDNLSDLEKRLFNNLNADLKIIKDELDGSDWGFDEEGFEAQLALYETNNKYSAQNKFEDYIKSPENTLENVGQNSYIAWRDGLLAMADGDTILQKELLTLAEKQFPDYAEYFNNLESAKKQFVAYEGTNKFNFLKNLSPEDLNSAMQIPDLFEEGLDGATKKIEEFKADPANQIAIEIDTEALEKLSESVDDFVSKQKTLNDAFEEQKENGQLSASTIQELTEAGYAQALSINTETGAVTLNKQAYEKLNAEKKREIQLDLEKQKADILTVYSEQKQKISELNKELATANSLRAKEILLEYESAKAAEKVTEEQLAAVEARLNALNAPAEFDNSSSKKKDPKQVTDFLADYSAYQHEIAMGRMAEDQDYYDWLASAAEKAYAGLKDYEEDLWKYQEEVYEGRKQLADDYLNNRIENREAQIEITLDTSKADDGTKLNTKEKFDYVRDCYREILAEIETRINDLIQSGVATNSEAIQELEKQAQEYRDKLDGVLTDEIEIEIDYLKNMQDEWDKVYDDKIDAIEKEKSAMEERYDSEIEALQKANDEKQKEYDIEKARQELEKASQRTRKVYGADGTVGYRQDTEQVAEAQKNLDDLLVEKQIEALKEQKKLETEKFDKQIKLLEQEQTTKQEFYNKLLEILENYLNPKATESNSNVWESVLGDTENVKKSNGNVEVKGTDIDTSDLKKGIMTAVDVDNWLKQLGASLEVIQSYIDGDGKTTTMAMQTSSNATASNQFDNQHKTTWKASADDYKFNSGSTENITYTIGDIHINNPVGNSDDLAKEFATKFPNAIYRQMYTNLKK